jgi:hypothetical protein
MRQHPAPRGIASPRLGGSLVAPQVRGGAGSREAGPVCLCVSLPAAHARRYFGLWLVALSQPCPDRQTRPISNPPLPAPVCIFLSAGGANQVPRGMGSLHPPRGRPTFPAEILAHADLPIQAPLSQSRQARRSRARCPSGVRRREDKGAAGSGDGTITVNGFVG